MTNEQQEESVKILDLENELDRMVESRSGSMKVDAVLDNPETRLKDLVELGGETKVSEILSTYVKRNNLVKV